MSEFDDTLNSPDRARQFLPFAALTGFGDAINEVEAGEEEAFADAWTHRSAHSVMASDSSTFREIRQTYQWDLRRARILRHEEYLSEERGIHGRCDSEEEF